MEQRGCEGLSPEEIVARYSDMIYRLAVSQMRNKSDADDVYQEVFLRYFRKRPEFLSEERQKAWFLRVTLNCCKRQWASPWRKRSAPLEEAEGFSFPSPEESSLREHFLRLPPQYRAVLHLFYYEDMSVEETARILGRKPSTVRTQLTRARRLLKEYFEDEL